MDRYMTVGLFPDIVTCTFISKTLSVLDCLVATQVIHARFTPIRQYQLNGNLELVSADDEERTDVPKNQFLKTKGDPYIVANKTHTFEDCGVFLESVVDNELLDAMIAANINVLRREAAYAYFFSSGVTLEEWFSSWRVQNQPYLKSLNSKQLQQGVWLINPELEFETTTVVTAVLSGDILPLARPMQDSQNCLLCLPKTLTLEDIDILFAEGSGTADSLEVLLKDGGFLLSIVDFLALRVKTYDVRILEYFAS